MQKVIINRLKKEIAVSAVRRDDKGLVYFYAQSVQSIQFWVGKCCIDAFFQIGLKGLLDTDPVDVWITLSHYHSGSTECSTIYCCVLLQKVWLF